MAEHVPEDAETRLFGVLVTYKRPMSLERSMRAIAAQERRLDGLVIVDNAPSPESRDVARSFAKEVPLAYVPSPVNLGPAGGRALGARTILERADDEDWVVFFDDDDPLPTTEILGRLTMTMSRMSHHSAIAGVGLRGARLNRRTGRVTPVGSGKGMVSVDHLHGGFFPCYRTDALRRVGSFDARMVFGFEELELGLRLRRAGYELWADGNTYRSVEALMGHPSPLRVPRVSLAEPSLRGYYAMRNHLYVLRREGLTLQLAWWALIAGVLKPSVWLPLQPRRAASVIRTNFAAIRDAVAGRLGPREWDNGALVVEP